MKLWLAGLLLLLAGCGTIQGAFTRPTGTICVPRQDFVNSWAVVKVLYKQARAEAETYCLAKPSPEARGSCLGNLHSLDTNAKVLAIQVDAKIEIPEAELDWEAITTMLKLIASLIP